VHFTKRLLDAQVPVARVVVAIAAAGSLTASCSSVEDSTHPAVGPDASLPDEPLVDGGVLDAEPPGLDAGAPGLDAAKWDAGAVRPVVCASARCATSLTTTFGEGFCALLRDGTVACWGQNNAGQLGRGQHAGTNDGRTAERVVGVEGVVELARSCAIDSAGATWCWGTGPFLRSELSATTTELTPVKLPIPPATKVGVAERTACAVVDGGVLCWGENSNGQIAVPELGANAALSPRAITIPPGAPITSLFVGSASFVLRADGTVVSWGANPPLARVSSLFPDPYPRDIQLASVSSMGVDRKAACATADGTAYCWGLVRERAEVGAGQLGSVLLERALPRPIVTPEPVVQIATASDGSVAALLERACACGVSGDVHCWGNNASGQVGDGTKAYALAPVRVAGLPEPAAQVKTSARSTCALLTSGRVFCWGDNMYGQLGSGRQQSLVPVEIVLP